MQCDTHPHIETHLACQKCGKAICFQCMVETPVGFRCKDCARLRANPLFTLSRDELMRAVGAVIGLTIAAAVVWGLVNGIGFLFLRIVVALGVGNLMAQGVSRAANGKPVPSLRYVVGAGALVAWVFGGALGLYWFDDAPFVGALTHFWATGYASILDGQGNVVFEVYGGASVWGILAGILSVGMAVSAMSRR